MGIDKPMTRVTLFGLVLALSACVQSGGVGTVPDGTGDGQWNPGNQPQCNGTVYACSDGQDNDGDKLADARDPECVGPCDNDEGSFATGIPGDNMDPCRQDCFFDGNSGQGDDKCEWNLKCDPQSPGANLAKPCPYDPGHKDCPASQKPECLSNCLGYTPNGCDCFGCCEVYISGQKQMVYLGSGTDCTTATPQSCAPCTQVLGCLNPCEQCELCLGRTIADLPATCFPTGDAGPAPQLPSCPPKVTPCLENSACETDHYCVTGCCIKAPD